MFCLEKNNINAKVNKWGKILVPVTIKIHQEILKKTQWYTPVIPVTRTAEVGE